MTGTNHLHFLKGTLREYLADRSESCEAFCCTGALEGGRIGRFSLVAEVSLSGTRKSTNKIQNFNKSEQVKQ